MKRVEKCRVCGYETICVGGCCDCMSLLCCESGTRRHRIQQQRKKGR